MPSKNLHEPSNDSRAAVLDNVESNDQASILIFISAKALGSVGFAVSLLAIWLAWLLPAFITMPAMPPDDIDVSKPKSHFKHPRRPTSHGPNSLFKPLRRASAPVHLTPIIAHHPEESQNNSRRVYFSDIPPVPITRRNTMPERPQDGHTEDPLHQAVLRPVDEILVSSASTLVMPASRPGFDYFEEAARESDSSMQSCKSSLLKSASRLQKLKLGFHVKSNRSEVIDKMGDESSVASTETAASDRSARHASGSTFVPSWTLTRNRTAPDLIADAGFPSPSRLSFTRRKASSRPLTSPASKTSTPPDLLPPTLSSRKQKRASAPIPRTSPYGAPYFAMPPLLISNNHNVYPTYLQRLPQFEDEVQLGHSRPSDVLHHPRGRNPTIRRVSLNPTTVVHKRSASEDWSQRQVIHS